MSILLSCSECPEILTSTLFRFYTFIPASPPFSESRTFIVLPKRTSREHSYFLQARNGVAPDELQAHTGMFSGKTNDGYYDLGLVTAKIIREALTLGREHVPIDTTNSKGAGV